MECLSKPASFTASKRGDDMLFEAAEYATEERLFFEVGVDQHIIAVVSGYGTFSALPTGPSDDMDTLEIDLSVVVGPYFDRILHVSPLATLASWANWNADEDDMQMFGVQSCSWDALSGFDGVPPSYTRVLLTATVSVEGDWSQIRRLGYHAVIEGQGLININTPGPSHY